MRRTLMTVAATFAVCAVLFFIRPTRAQDAPAPVAVSSPMEIIDQIMSQIGQGRIDEAIAMMEGLNSQPDLKQAARSRLLDLRGEQSQYRNYEIAAVQRFTGQFETVDVMAYYDEQPVLYRFHLYRSQNQPNVRWSVLGFHVTTAVQEITEVLKDAPVDYVGQKKAK